MFITSLTENKRNLTEINSSVLIGFIEGTDKDVLVRAVENEFGTDKVPERSFIRSTIDEHMRDIVYFVKKLIPSVLFGELPEEDMIMKVGRYVKELIEYKIATASSWATPLAPSTIRKKGHSRPLIETYEMITSIKFKVE